MITLMEYINATAWTQPENHIKITLWDKSKVYEEGEFEDIELNVKTLAQYGNCEIGDIDIVCSDEDSDDYYLHCLVHKE